MLIGDWEVAIHDLVKDKATGRMGGVTGFSVHSPDDPDEERDPDQVCIAYQDKKLKRVVQHWFLASDAEPV